MSDVTTNTPDVVRECQATPRDELMQRLMASEVPKNELEWCAKDEIERLRDDMEAAWGLIANAYGGDWDRASPVWKRAAERWRDEAWYRVAGSIDVKEEKIDEP